ncbi:protein cepu-1 [Plakobranchus ocellatus]|uniref:Protein cepu-1 n=1 Tax=Plakobranchus ocellatus TaxID=259542 RepID=A0AAV3XYA8_9GAST|nr:protein cepu-1 [Plakobranchus ocellatus]
MSNAGTYQCQITDKVPLRMHVHLTVKPRPPPKPAAVKIIGEPFVDQGEPIQLICNATGPRVPEKIDWFKDGTKLDAAAHGGMLIEEFMRVEHHALVSKLKIRNTDTKSSGTYICRSSDKKIDSLKVTVLVADTMNKKRETDSHVDVKNKDLLIGGDKEETEGAKDGSISAHPTLSLVLTLSMCTALYRILS